MTCWGVALHTWCCRVRGLRVRPENQINFMYGKPVSYVPWLLNYNSIFCCNLLSLKVTDGWLFVSKFMLPKFYTHKMPAIMPLYARAKPIKLPVLLDILNLSFLSDITIIAQYLTMYIRTCPKRGCKWLSRNKLQICTNGSRMTLLHPFIIVNKAVCCLQLWIWCSTVYNTAHMFTLVLSFNMCRLSSGFAIAFVYRVCLFIWMDICIDIESTSFLFSCITVIIEIID